MEWTTLAAFVPAMTLAGSAMAYVIKLYLDARERRRTQFFELMKFIDGQGSIAAKVAAIYSLREFREHREFIVRFCATQRSNIEGSNPTARDALVGEFDRTKEFLEGNRP